MPELLIDLSERNCNGRIDIARKEQDRISRMIDDAMFNCGDSLRNESHQYHDLVNLYHNIQDTIEKLCIFRRSHDCLIEGDPGYQYR